MKPAQKLQAQLVIVTGLLVLHLIFEIQVLLYIATGLALVFLIFPFIGNLFVKLWFKLAEGLGWINSRILLSIVFFVILFPVALLYRLRAKNPLQLKQQKDSYFTERNHQYVADDLKNPW